MSAVADLPVVGGDATSVAFLDAETLVAAIDGKLYTVPVAGGAPTLLDGGAAYASVAVGGNGEIYAFTGDEFWVVDSKGEAPRKADLPARTPQTLNTYFSVGPDGQPYVRILSYPSVIKIYTSADAGQTWTLLPLPMAHTYGGGLAFGETTDEIYLSDPVGFHASKDGGKSWVSSPAAIPNYGPEIVRRKNGDLLCYVPGGGGLSVSHDGGAKFTDVSPFNAYPFINELVEADDETLYATVTAAGSATTQLPVEVVKSTDDGATWKHVYFSQARDFALLGDQLAVAQSASGAGGLALSADGGKTFVTTGLSNVKLISSFGFDKQGALLIMGDGALFRRQPGGWQSVGGPTGAMLATTPKGIIYAAPGFVSDDDGATWAEVTLPPYNYGGVGLPGFPVVLALREEDLIISRTTFRDDLGMHTNGMLVRVTPTGDAESIMQGNNHVAMLQDADGVLYARTENFAGNYRSTDSGTTWQEVDVPAPGFAIDNHNRFVNYGELGSYRSGHVGNDSTSELKLNGFTPASNAITSAKFDGKDRLYLLAGGQLFAASGSL